jgi:hypothetical protein
MNFSLAFLHGEQVVLGFIFAAAIVLLGLPLLLYVWLRHTRLSERKLAFAFLMLSTGVCSVIAFSTPDSGSIFVFTAFFIAFIFSIPWSVITYAALYLAGNLHIGDHEFALVMLLGAGINTMLLYFAAKKMRGLIP